MHNKYMKIYKIFSNNANNFSKLIQQRGSFIKVYHPTCGHCLDMKDDWKKLEKTAKSLPYNYQLIDIHADAVPDIDKQFEVEGFPTLLTLRKGGEVHNEYKGDRSYADLLKFLKKHLKKENVLKSKLTKKKYLGGAKRKRKNKLTKKK